MVFHREGLLAGCDQFEVGFDVGTSNLKNGSRFFAGLGNLETVRPLLLSEQVFDEVLKQRFGYSTSLPGTLSWHIPQKNITKTCIFLLQSLREGITLLR
jgi:hypothetical protein